MLPLSLANMTGGNLNVEKILSMASAESLAVLNFKGAVCAKRLNASIMTKIYFIPLFLREYFL